MKKRLMATVLVLIFAILPLLSCSNKEKEELQRQVEEYRAAKISLYAEENLRYADYEVDVAFLGDSLTDGYDLARHYPDYTVSNRGIAGDTTVGLEARLGVSVYDLKPKVAVMLIGANNMPDMLDNYEDILVGFKENLPNTQVILLSLTSMSGEWGKNNRLAAYNNVQIKMLAEKYSYDFVDLYSPLLDLSTGEIYAEYTTDGGHLTEAGYNVLTREITPPIKLALARWHGANT